MTILNACGIIQMTYFKGNKTSPISVSIPLSREHNAVNTLFIIITQLQHSLDFVNLVFFRFSPLGYFIKTPSIIQSHS